MAQYRDFKYHTHSEQGQHTAVELGRENLNSRINQSWDTGIPNRQIWVDPDRTDFIELQKY